MSPYTWLIPILTSTSFCPRYHIPHLIQSSLASHPPQIPCACILIVLPLILLFPPTLGSSRNLHDVVRSHPIKSRRDLQRSAILRLWRHCIQWSLPNKPGNPIRSTRWLFRAAASLILLLHSHIGVSVRLESVFQLWTLGYLRPATSHPGLDRKLIEKNAVLLQLRLVRRAATENKDVMNKDQSVVHVRDSSWNADTENLSLQRRTKPWLRSWID